MADIDGDGRDDIITGAFTGFISCLRRSPDGTFCAPEGLQDEEGHALGLGKVYDINARTFRQNPTAKHRAAQALSAAPIDWDSDGDLDLVFGEVDGRLLLCRNDGTKTEPSFSVSPERIKAGRKTMWVESGHSMPVAADWDGDGLFDLLSGANDGSVTLWRNTGSAGAPSFGEPECLVEPAPGTQGSAARDADPVAETRPARRSQPHVADFDGDGLLDLLVGDYRRVGEGAESKAHGFVWLYRRVRASD